MSETVDAFPLTWPAHWPRAPRRESGLSRNEGGVMNGRVLTVTVEWVPPINLNPNARTSDSTRRRLLKEGREATARDEIGGE